MPPQRIRLSRARGWRKPAGAVVVSRPSKWGNPYTVVEDRGGYIVRDADRIQYGRYGDVWAARARAVELYQQRVIDTWRPDRRQQVRAALRGRDLACWCPLDHPCHGDALIAFANTPARRN